jgi:hypothetical protein
MFVWNLAYLTYLFRGLPDHALHPNWRTSTRACGLLCHIFATTRKSGSHAGVKKELSEK